MDANLKKEIEEASWNLRGVNSWKHNNDVEKTLHNLVNIVKILASEIDRLEQEKVSHAS